MSHRHEQVPNLDRFHSRDTSPVGLLAFALNHSVRDFRNIPRDLHWVSAKSIYDNLTEAQRETFRTASRGIRANGCPRAVRDAFSSMAVMLRAVPQLRDAVRDELGKFPTPAYFPCSRGC